MQKFIFFTSRWARKLSPLRQINRTSASQSDVRFFTSKTDSDKIPPFSKILSMEQLRKVVGNLSIEVGSINDNFELPIDAAEIIGERIVPALTYNVSIVRTKKEGSRYFFVFDILKEFIRIGRGRNIDLELYVGSPDGAISTEIPSDSASDSDTDDEKPLTLWPEHEAYFGQKGVTSKGFVEFVVFDGPEKDSKICSVFEVQKLPPAYPFYEENLEDPALCQLFAELIAAVQFNNKLDPAYDGCVGGALTDGYAWHFCRARKNPQGGFIIQIEKHYEYFMTRSRHYTVLGSETTTVCMEHLFHVLYPNIQSIDGKQVHAHFDTSDRRVQSLSDAFLDSMIQKRASRMKIEEAEAATVKAEAATVKAEAATVKAEAGRIEAENDAAALRKQLAATDNHKNV